jgi:hypothetical protein
MGSKSNSQNQSQSTSSQGLDPAIKSSLLGNYGNVQSLVANTPSQYSGQLIAPFNPTQTAGQQGLLDLGASNTGDAALSGAGTAIGSAATYKPNTVNPISLAGVNLSPYENPYTSDVINTTMAQLNQQNKIANNANDASATSAGAFGGDRSAVQDALTNGQYAMTGATTLAGLNQGNFSQAQAAAQGDITNNLQAQEANQSAGLTGANLNLQAGQGLSALSAQQWAQALAKAGIPLTVGGQQQALTQSGLDASRNQFQTNLGNKVTMQQLVNQALGLMGNPTLTQAQQTGSGSSSSMSINGVIPGLGIPGVP